MGRAWWRDGRNEYRISAVNDNPFGDSRALMKRSTVWTGLSAFVIFFIGGTNRLPRRGGLFVSAILDSLCKEFLSANVSAILYLMNYEQYGRSTASAQYFLQLAGYLGIPVIAWNADNSGLERVSYG